VSEFLAYPAWVRIFIDTDCGVDDALALAVLVSRPEFEIIGVTTTSGNTSAVQAARNVSDVLAVMRHHIPVIAGPEPDPSFKPRLVHGPDGLGGHGSPPLRAGDPHAASRAIREFCDSAGSEDVLLCLGPMTNLAAAQPQSNPRIVAVGGAGIVGERDPGRDPNSEVDISSTKWVIDNLAVEWVTINAGENLWLGESEFRSSTAIGRFLRAIHESYGWHCAERAGRQVWSPSAYDTVAALAAAGSEVGRWEWVSPTMVGASLWGTPGGDHRMLTVPADETCAGVVRSAVSKALA
jgi:purine nucleosidase